MNRARAGRAFLGVGYCRPSLLETALIDSSNPHHHTADTDNRHEPCTYHQSGQDTRHPVTEKQRSDDQRNVEGGLEERESVCPRLRKERVQHFGGQLDHRPGDHESCKELQIQDAVGAEFELTDERAAE